MHLQYDLIIYGSAANGIAVKGEHSDLDLSLVLPNLPEHVSDGKTRESCYFRIFKTLETQFKNANIPDVSLIINSFGLQLQLKLTNSLTVDLFINKILDCYNSALILTYSLLDSRFHKLAIILKLLNKFAFKDKGKRLNSYSLNLMLIAYLIKKGVLPSVN